MGIEDRCDDLQSRVEQIEERFSALVNVLRAAFGDEEAQALAIMKAEVDLYRSRSEAYVKELCEMNSLLVDLAHILKMKTAGGVTRDGIKEAARKAMTKKK